MAGGKGERFWPWSRNDRPKHLLPLFGRRTMVEMTVARLRPLLPKKQIWIVTNAQQARVMKRLMPWFCPANFIVEPVGRDSAGAVMLGCARVAARDPRAVTALLPADHLIRDQRGFQGALRACFQVAEGRPLLVTLGVRPRFATSALGYIGRGVRIAVEDVRGAGVFRVADFVEKPHVERARRLISGGRFYWNTGIFTWSVRAIREALGRHSAGHARGWDLLLRSRRRYLARGFHRLPKISIDYAVMEKAQNVCVVQGEFDWDDVGSWSALYAHLPHDPEGNCRRGNVIASDTRGCLLFGDKRPLVTLGVRDLVVIQTADATLVCHRDHAWRLKDALKRLAPRQPGL